MTGSPSRDSRMASTTDILQSYEEMFAQRYTSEDEEYQKYVKRPADPPPIVEDWLNREPNTPNISEILQNYEKMFAHRYTAKDEEYQKYVQRAADPPPLIEDWRNRSGGNQRYRDRYYSETTDSLKAEETDTTSKEAIDPTSGKKEAGVTTIHNTDKDKLPTPNMDECPSMVMVHIRRGPHMVITSIAISIECPV
ncbi:hypothetical protein JD844_014484 [Phrynosoma platyrhinos]|uniref:RNMT-activating mini protein n=1 Tax=Phrynosoma platyrhinos TaxID=52577 RepID=A0ABQ7SRS6_PHRPL|nr:hypothetical protein JD844_014484 [Phrynosoma platyrhinos]